MPYIQDELFSSAHAQEPLHPPSIHDNSYSSVESYVNNWGLQNDDEGYASDLLSLACLFKHIFPEKALKDLIREVDERPPPMLAQHLCLTFSKELKLELPESSTGDFSKPITNILDALKARQRLTTISCAEFEFTGRATDILQRVDGKGEELPGGLNTNKHFALTTGYFVGKSGWLAYPGASMGQILQIATILPRRE